MSFDWAGMGAPKVVHEFKKFSRSKLMVFRNSAQAGRLIELSHRLSEDRAT